MIAMTSIQPWPSPMTSGGKGNMCTDRESERSSFAVQVQPLIWNSLLLFLHACT